MATRFSPITGRYVHLTVQGVEYRVYFEEAGEGTPVLMQHTAGSDGRQWRHILEDEKLTSEFRFIAHDLPYHGKSLPPLGKPWWRERYSLSQSFAVDFIEAMTKALGIEKGIYVGCSMGGHLAPDLALARAGTFSRCDRGRRAGLRRTIQSPSSSICRIRARRTRRRPDSC